MSTLPQTLPRTTVDEFLAWAEGRAGRYDLVKGEVVGQTAERAADWKVKPAFRVFAEGRSGK